MTHHPNTVAFDGDFNKFRLALLREREIPLKVSLAFGICQNKEDAKAVFDRMAEEKFCSDKILLKIVEIGKSCLIDISYESPSFLRKLGL